MMVIKGYSSAQKYAKEYFVVFMESFNSKAQLPTVTEDTDTALLVTDMALPDTEVTDTDTDTPAATLTLTTQPITKRPLYLTLRTLPQWSTLPQQSTLLQLSRMLLQLRTPPPLSSAIVDHQRMVDIIGKRQDQRNNIYHHHHITAHCPPRRIITHILQ